MSIKNLSIITFLFHKVKTRISDCQYLLFVKEVLFLVLSVLEGFLRLGKEHANELSALERFSFMVFTLLATIIVKDLSNGLTMC